MKPAVVCELTSDFEQYAPLGVKTLRRVKSTMELFLTPREDRQGYIGWDIPRLERYEEISLWWNTHKHLTQFAGLPALPREVLPLLAANGVFVGERFPIGPLPPAPLPSHLIQE